MKSYLPKNLSHGRVFISVYLFGRLSTPSRRPLLSSLRQGEGHPGLSCYARYETVSRFIKFTILLVLLAFIASPPSFAADNNSGVIIFSDSRPNITINFIGDVILGRTVALQMKNNGVLYPFLKTASLTADADLTVANLETPLSNRVKPVYHKTMDFIAPTESIKGLLYAGIDLVTLANNHSTNYGEGPFADTLRTLQDNNIAYLGGGKNSKEAGELRVVTVNGIKFGFLNYNSIIGSANATANKFGVNYIHIKPWSETDSAEDIARMMSNIKQARPKCDVLIVMIHWGVEYKPPIPTVTTLAHKFIDNGADMVIGTHPHIIQPVETYKGKIIAYSLGNFVFDQMWAEYTREGYMLQVYLAGKEVTGFRVYPYRIYDYCQPMWDDDPALLKKVLPNTNGK